MVVKKDVQRNYWDWVQDNMKVFKQIYFYPSVIDYKKLFAHIYVSYCRSNDWTKLGLN